MAPVPLPEQPTNLDIAQKVPLLPSHPLLPLPCAGSNVQGFETFAKTVDVIFGSIVFKELVMKAAHNLKQRVVQYVTQRQVDKMNREMQEQLAELMRGMQEQPVQQMEGAVGRKRGLGRREVRWDVDEI
jgi:hypothetical protein